MCREWGGPLSEHKIKQAKTPTPPPPPIKKKKNKAKPFGLTTTQQISVKFVCLRQDEIRFKDVITTLLMYNVTFQFFNILLTCFYSALWIFLE